MKKPMIQIRDNNGLPNIVHIRWRDCSSINDWLLPPEAIEYGCPEIHSVGFLIDDNDEFVTIALCWEEQFGKIGSITNIPHGQIIKIIPLKMKWK